MTHTLNHQARQSGVTLAVAVACAVLGSATTQAAPVSEPTFLSADISVERRGEEAGGLTCSWREAGLGPYAVVYYSCEAGAVGVVEGCVYKNKLVSNTPTELSVFKDVTGETGHDPGIAFLSKNNGQVNGSTTTAIPEAHGGEAHLCTEPTVQAVLAVRWCNASLTDLTNNIVGANFSELYQEFYSGVGIGSVPSCSELEALPPTDGGGG